MNNVYEMKNMNKIKKINKMNEMLINHCEHMKELINDVDHSFEFIETTYENYNIMHLQILKMRNKLKLKL